MKFFQFVVKRPIAITMMILFVLVLGFVSLTGLKLDLMPEMDLPIAVVVGTYTGVSPEEMENLVTRPLEQRLGTLSGIDTMTTMTAQGMSAVLMQFNWGTNIDNAINDIRNQLEITSYFLPSDMERPMVIKMDINQMPVITMTISGTMPFSELTNLAEDTIQPQLERVAGVASVTLMGGVTREIRLSAEPQRLQAYGYTINSLASVIASENRNVSAGDVEEGMKEHSLRIVGEFSSLEELENLMIPGSRGENIRLKDLVRIEDTFKDMETYAYINGQQGMSMALSKASDANTVDVSDAVAAALERVRETIPDHVHIDIGMDQADIIRRSINTVVNNAVTGAVLAIVILFIFLQSLRSTLIIATAIPFSIISTFVLMFFGHISLNVISLGGLALGVGMMVDNAIVILENIFRHRQLGKTKTQSAIEGAKEVGGAVVASTITTVVVFLPFVFISGLAGQIFKPMAMTVSFSLTASLFSALTLVPMMSARLLRTELPRGFVGRVVKGVQRLLGGLEQIYRKLLGWALRHRKTVIITIFVLLIGSLALIPMIGMQFMAGTDTGEYSISIELPNGVAMRETLRVARQVEAMVMALPEHEWVRCSVGGGTTGMGALGGGGSGNVASIDGRLTSVGQRTRSIEEIMEALRQECAQIPGAEIELSVTGGMMSMGAGDDISVELKGNDLELLRAFSEALMDQIQPIEGVREITSSLTDGNPEIQVRINREKAGQYGLTAAQVSAAVSTALNGTTASSYREGGDEYDIRLILDEKYRKNINDVSALTIISPGGQLLTLADVSDMVVTAGPSTIIRENQVRSLTVSGKVVGRDAGTVNTEIQAAIAGMTVPDGVAVDFGGSQEMMNETFGDLFRLLALAVVLVYMVLAIQFEQILYPFIIMFAMPPTVIGVLAALFLTRRAIDVTVLIGVIMLAGIVVNNAIILVDYINTVRKGSGMSRYDAIMQAAPTRLRPILMTTLTTVLGLLPMTLGIGEGAEMTSALATSVVGGLTFSTLITLVFVPCVYVIVENFSLWVKKKAHKLVMRGKRRRHLADAPDYE
jgi:HAE1 family hydrophobic/amphiphilic exporter-1